MEGRAGWAAVNAEHLEPAAVRETVGDVRRGTGGANRAWALRFTQGWLCEHQRLFAATGVAA
jgi:hypothetical protein